MAVSLVRVLSNAMVMEMLLKSDGLNDETKKLKTALPLEYSLFQLPTTLSDAFIQTFWERPTYFEQYGGRKWRSSIKVLWRTTKMAAKGGRGGIYV
jgi:hypothetical protein